MDATNMENPIDIQNAINLLIKEGYFLQQKMVEGEEHLYNAPLQSTYKLQEFYKKMKEPHKPSPTTVVIPSKRITLDEFKELAEIPFRIKANNGTTYTVSGISKEALKVFNSEIVGKVNMDALIKATKAYYADTKAYRVILSNYFINGVWKDALKEWEKNPTEGVANPKFTGERKI